MQVKEWLANNIGRWTASRPDWYKLELVPDEFLPTDIIEAEGGANRRRSSVSVREIVSLFVPDSQQLQQQQQLPVLKLSLKESEEEKEAREAWVAIATEIYDVRSNNYKSNSLHIKRIFNKPENKMLVIPLLALCPLVGIILSFILEDRFGLRVQKVQWTTDMKEWSIEDCRRVGSSLSTFVRKRKTGDAALE